MRTLHRLAPGLVLVAGLLVLGCKPKVVNTELPKAKQNLVTIARAYFQANTDLKRPPRSLDEFLPFVKAYGDPNDLLTSPTDGKPYVIVYNLNLATDSPIAYEQEGQGGKRKVVGKHLTVQDLTAEEFARLTFPPGHQPPKP